MSKYGKLNKLVVDTYVLGARVFVVVEYTGVVIVSYSVDTDV